MSEHFFASFFNAHIGLPEAQSTALWTVLSSRQREHARHAFNKLEATKAYSPRRGVLAVEFVASVLQPALLIERLEAAVQRGELSRQAANSIEEKLLAVVDATGAWR